MVPAQRAWEPDKELFAGHNDGIFAYAGAILAITLIRGKYKIRSCKILPEDQMTWQSSA